MGTKRQIENDCERASFLVEKQLCTSLSVTEHLDKKIHLIGCSVCRTYQKQSRLIDKMVSKTLKEDPPLLQTDDAFKNLLHLKIDEQLN